MHAEVPATEPKPANEDAKTRVAAAAPAAAPPVTPVPVSQVTDASPAAAASATPSPSSREPQITELLSLARRALESDRLMIPAQNNAYHYYQRVLALQPGNSAALAGMDKIVARYAVLAQQALDRQDLDKATRYIARGLRVQPGEGGLLALQERIDRINSALLTASAEPEPPPPVVVPESKEKPKGFLLRMKEFFTRRSDGAQE
jgi:serine/threonine-protein kinase PpkA